MTQYELIPSDTNLTTATVKSYSLPELVHEDDPATSVMSSFRNGCALRINKSDTINSATHEMKSHNAHVLFVIEDDNEVVGIVTTEDVLGEKPIKLLQESRIKREEITVKMLMTPLNNMMTFNISDIKNARVGNVVATLKHHHQHYALVVSTDPATNKPILRGLFNTSQISRQLHTDIEHSINQASSVSELKKGRESD